MAIAAIMFDLDGTLIETMDGFADVAAAVMEAHHGLDRVDARRLYLATSGIPFHQQLERIAPAHPENPRAAAEFERRKRAVCDDACMTSETVAALEELRAAGIALVVSSSAAQHFVEDFQARERFRFDLALGFDATAGLAKGSPHVARTCRALGVTPPQLLFCGDSLADGELARECGVAFVGRLGTFTLAEFRRWNPRVATVPDVASLAVTIFTLAAA